MSSLFQITFCSENRGTHTGPYRKQARGSHSQKVSFLPKSIQPWLEPESKGITKAIRITSNLNKYSQMGTSYKMQMPNPLNVLQINSYKLFCSGLDPSPFCSGYFDGDGKTPKFPCFKWSPDTLFWRDGSWHIIWKYMA